MSTSRSRSSKNVFLQHVVYPPDGEPDVSGVFSKECFLAWLESRSKPPARPEESFRKALIAHVAGKDKRNPFAEHIEKKLLERLREHKAWPAFADCTNGCQRIGERGINSLGFHEQKKQAIQQKADKDGSKEKDKDSDIRLQGDDDSERSRKRRRTSQDEKAATVTTLQSLPFLSTKQLPEVLNSKLYSERELEILKSKLQLNFNQRVARSLLNRNVAEEFLRFLYQTNQSFSGVDTSTNSQILSHFLLETYSDAQLAGIAINAALSGREVFNQNLQVQMDNFPSELGYFYSEEFICPTSNRISSTSVEDRFDVFTYFDSSKPIGRFVRRADGIIVDSNEAANKILDPQGKSLIGRNSGDFLVSVLHQFLVYRYVFPKMCMGRLYKFFRSILNLNGEIRVFRNVFTKDPLNNFDICFQEETDVFRSRISTELLFL